LLQSKNKRNKEFDVFEFEFEQKVTRSEKRVCFLRLNAPKGRETIPFTSLGNEIFVTKPAHPNPM
jgi:hypothetical protein